MNQNDHRAVEAAARYWREAFGLAWQLCGDRAEAEDLCQEAILRIGSMGREVDRSRPLRPLVLAIVRNLARSAARRRRPGSLAAADAAASLVDPRSPDPCREAGRSEQASVVQAVLRTLSPSLRAALFLRDGLDLSYAEIGVVLGKSEDVVRVTLHRARTRMRAALARSFSLREEVEP